MSSDLGWSYNLLEVTQPVKWLSQEPSWAPWVLIPHLSATSHWQGGNLGWLTAHLTPQTAGCESPRSPGSAAGCPPWPGCQRQDSCILGRWGCTCTNSHSPCRWARPQSCMWCSWAQRSRSAPAGTRAAAPAGLRKGRVGELPGRAREYSVSHTQGCRIPSWGSADLCILGPRMATPGPDPAELVGTEGYCCPSDRWGTSKLKA